MKERTQTLHAVHRMIQALGQDEQLASRLASDRGGLFADFGLGEEEVAALNTGTISALAAIGVHPMYRMHWMMMSNPDSAAYLSVNEYIDKAQAGAQDG